MNDILVENTKAIANIISKNIDRETKVFLDIYNLPYDINELENKGYVLIKSEEGGWDKKKYKIKLCKIVDTKEFVIKTSLTIK